MGVLLLILTYLQRLTLSRYSQFIEMFGSCELVPLSHYVESLIGGKSLAGGSSDSAKVITTGAVSRDEFLENEYKYLPDDYEPNPEHKIELSDVLVCRKNSLEFVGATAYVNGLSQDLYLSDLVWKLKRKDNCNPRFISRALIMPSTKQRIQSLASGTCGSMRNISKPKLMSVEVPHADFELQEEFAAFARQADKSESLQLKVA